MPTLTKPRHFESLGKELADDPLGLGLSGMDDNAAAAALSAPQATQEPAPIDIDRVAQVLVDADKWLEIEGATRSAAPAVKTAATGLWTLLNSKRNVEVSPRGGALKRWVDVLVGADVLTAADVTALRSAARQEVRGVSRGLELGIGEIAWQFVWQVRNPTKKPPWLAAFEGPGHALAIADTTGQVITTQTITNLSSVWSAEQDFGANTVVSGVEAYFTVTGFASAPATGGNMLITALPYYSTGGTAFNSYLFQQPFYVSADALYNFHTYIGNFTSRYWMLGVENRAGYDTDASAVSAWVGYQKVTV